MKLSLVSGKVVIEKNLAFELFFSKSTIAILKVEVLFLHLKGEFKNQKSAV